MTDHSIAIQIIQLIKDEGLEAGAHVPAQKIADLLRVSRSPVNEALALLNEKGVVTREKNRGFFVAKAISGTVSDTAQELGMEKDDFLTRTYFQIADDRLKGLLPDTFSEQLIRRRYQLTSAQLSTLLNRIAQEGWAERRQGYGWQFSPMLTTSDSLLQSYRLRLALEPAALLEPGYHLEPAVAERCRAMEERLLAGGIATASVGQLHDRGVNFHESLIMACGNRFFIDTIRRVNRVRRLLSYRSMQNRERYVEHAKQHLHILDLLERGQNAQASTVMREHLIHTLTALSDIRGLLDPQEPDGA